MTSRWNSPSRMTDKEKMDEHAPAAGKLKKELGVFGMFSYLFGGTVGSGIFVSPTFIFHTVKSGGMALTVWIVAGIIAILGGVSYCELGGLVKNSGGEYTFILKGFSFRGRKPFNIIGPLLAFSAVWTYTIILRPASFSVVMLTFAEYACKPFFSDHDEVPGYLMKMVAILFMILLGVLNCYSQKETVRVMNVLTVAKFGALLLIMVLGAIRIFSGQARMLPPSLGTGYVFNLGSFCIALYSAFWAYEGWTGAAYMVEEVKDVTLMPLVTVVSVFLTGFCYSMVVIAYMAALEPNEIEMITGQAIALPFAKKTMGSVGVLVIPLMVAMSTIGAANGTLFVASRVLFSASRNGYMPSCLSGLHRKSNTPIPAIIFQITLGVVITAAGNISDLISSFSAAIWVYYTLSFISLLIMRVTYKDEDRPFKVFFVVPLLLVFISLAIVVIPIKDQLVQSLSAFGGILLSVPVYFIFIYDGYQRKFFNDLNKKLTKFVFSNLNCVPPQDNDPSNLQE